MLMMCCYIRLLDWMKNCASLQSDLYVLQKWADDWQMRFNALKCQHISFCSKQVQINFNYMICNEVIKQVDSIKYLGVIIDKKITWSQQVDKIALKANRVRGFLYRNIKHCSLDIKNRCYKIFIQPILKYASIIWFCQEKIVPPKNFILGQKFSVIMLKIFVLP